LGGVRAALFLFSFFLFQFFQEEKLDFHSMSIAQTCRKRLIRRNDNFFAPGKSVQGEGARGSQGLPQEKPLDPRSLCLWKKTTGFPPSWE
jgi:hypothetical protein